MVTKEEIEKYEKENDKPHPVFGVEHKPERVSLSTNRKCTSCGYTNSESEFMKFGRDWKCPECDNLVCKEVDLDV